MNATSKKILKWAGILCALWALGIFGVMAKQVWQHALTPDKPKHSTCWLEPDTDPAHLVNGYGQPLKTVCPK